MACINQAFETTVSEAFKGMIIFPSKDSNCLLQEKKELHAHFIRTLINI